MQVSCSGGVSHYSVDGNGHDGHDDDDGDGGDDDNAGVLSLWGVMEAQVSVGNNDNEHFGATSPTHIHTRSSRRISTAGKG